MGSREMLNSVVDKYYCMPLEYALNLDLNKL